MKINRAGAKAEGNEEAAGRSPQFLPRVSLCRLQIQAHPLAVNENCSGVDQLLPVQS